MGQARQLMRRENRRSALLVTVVILLVWLTAGGTARAETAGANGQIAFLRLIPDQTDTELADVFIANPDGSHIQQVPVDYPPFVEPGIKIDWSPDGTKLLMGTVRFDSSGSCCLPFRPAIVNADGSGFKLLTMKYAPFDTSCSVWTPEQKRLLCGFGINFATGQPAGIFSVRASDGGDPRRLTTYPFNKPDCTGEDTPGCGGSDTPTDVSPDGRSFVFVRNKEEQTPVESTEPAAIFVENIDGTGLRQLTPYAYQPRSAAPQWSPDGTRIISETKTGGLFTVRPDGTGLRPIVLQVQGSSYFAFDPHWSPNGTRIVFCLSMNGTEGLYTANPDGSNVVQVTNAPTGFDGSPDWGTHPLTA